MILRTLPHGHGPLIIEHIVIKIQRTQGTILLQRFAKSDPSVHFQGGLGQVKERECVVHLECARFLPRLAVERIEV